MSAAAILAAVTDARAGRFAAARSFRHHAGMGFKKRPRPPLLATVDSIDWTAVETAYGAAGELPDVLRTLATDADAHARAHAFKWLDNRINHQGWANPAAAVVMPFLLELAADARVADRARLIELIANLSVGGTHTDFLSGDAGCADDELIGRIRATVAAARTRLLALLDDDSAAVRAAGAFLLGVVGDRGEELGPLLVTRLSSENDAIVRASMVIALGLVAKREDKLAAAALAAELAADSLLRRSAAAIALAHLEHPLGRAATALLVDAARSDERTIAGFPWGYGDLADLSARMLERYADAAALFDFIDGTPVPDQRRDPGRAIALTRAADRLLRLTIPSPLAAGSPATTLSDEQHRIVSRLASHPRLWTAHTATALALPASPEETRAWLGIETPAPAPTILDETIELDGKCLTLREWWKLASGEDEAPRRRLIAAVAINFTVNQAMDLWMRAHCDIPGEEHGPMSPALQLRIIGAFRESAEPALLRAAAELNANGPPQARRKIGGHWATVQFTRLYGYVGAALARIADELGVEADADAFALLSRAIAIMPELTEIRQAISAFPLDQAAELVIKSTRCFYWPAAPTDVVTAEAHRALSRFPSREHAEPYIPDYIAALADRGQADEAALLQSHWQAFLAGAELEFDEASQRIKTRE